MREALRLFPGEAGQIEITTLADIPAGTGLGSSGSFTTALLRALHAQARNIIHPRELAEQACHIEIDLLKEPIGKQDQYTAAFGGITCFNFRRDGTVDAHPLALEEDTRNALAENLLIFFTGYARSASDILRDQDTRSKQNDSSMLDNLHFVKDIGLRSKAALERGDLTAFGKLMHEHWEHKRKRSKRHVELADRPMVRSRHRCGRHRRQADRRRRRRLPDVLCRGKAAAAPRHARSRPDRGSLPLGF